MNEIINIGTEMSELENRNVNPFIATIPRLSEKKNQEIDKIHKPSKKVRSHNFLYSGMT